MFSLFITALATILIVGIGLYFWQKSALDNSERVLPPNADFRGLFGEDSPAIETEKKRLAAAAREQQESFLIARARDGELSSTSDANEIGDRYLCDRVLVELVRSGGWDGGVLGGGGGGAQNELPVNR